MRAALLRYPAFPLAALALAAFVWFAAANGGYDQTTWYPGALLLLGAVLVALVAVPTLPAPRLVIVAIAGLAAFAAWSYMSIAWAGQKGDAWDGANRTALYVLAFSLFAAWRPRARPAALMLGTFALGIAAVGLVELLRASAAADPAAFFLSGRFASPAGYQNASVALWFLAFWPCVALAARREAPPPVRGLLVAAAVLLCGLAVLGQSRGWLFVAPPAALIFIALVPGRVRTTLTLLLVLAATGAATPALLHVYQRSDTRAFAPAVSTAASALLIAAVIAGAIAWAAALADRRASPTRPQRRRAGRVLAVLACAAALAGLVVFVAERGSPFTAVAHGWRQFKTQPTPEGGTSRFSQSFGSNRYDFWRVAWNRFAHAPLAGIGADNFQEAYLARRRSWEEPRYPHSVELRTLSQTGLVGTVLLLGGLGAALGAALLAIRRRAGLGATVAAAATASFLYWLLHGSVDWFWEFPGLGGPAFAMLGLAAGLMPWRVHRGAAARPRVVGAAGPAAAVGTLVIAASFAAPWVSQLEMNSAIASWTRNPSGAFSRLDTASALNPLSAVPKIAAASIALRLGQDRRAETWFRQAIERDPGDAYSHLMLGSLLAQRGAHAEALATLTDAAALDPRDDVTAAALRRVRHGKRVNIAAVNAEIARRSLARGK